MPLPASIGPTGNPLQNLNNTGDITLTNQVVSFGGRFVFTMGETMPAANNFNISKTGLSFHVSGATQINLISNLGVQGGTEITLIFDSTPKVKNNQAVSGDYKPVLLNAGADFATAANNTLTLLYDSVNSVWIEKGRKA